MRKFKVLCDFGGGGFNDDDFMSWVEVEAESYEQAEEKARAKFNCDIDIDEIIDVFDTPLNDKYILFDSADGFTYGVPVMVIAEKRAYKNWGQYNQDFGLSMINDTLPLFESSVKAIIDFTKQEVKWADVKNSIIQMRKKKEKISHDDEWLNNKFRVM